MKQKKTVDDTNRIDLIALFYAMLLHWKEILLSAILAAGLAFTYRYVFINPVYESNSLLYVLNKSTSITSLADLQIGTNLTHDYLIVTKDRPVLEKVINYLSLSEDYEELEKKVEVTNPTNTRFIMISVKDEDPERAKVICDQIATFASAFIAEKMNQDPPILVRGGYSDGKPVNHGILYYTVMGFIVGFEIAAILVILHEIFNDDVNTPEDVENKVGLTVLASLPLDESEEM